MNDENLLSKELSFISTEACELVIDAVHCGLFSACLAGEDSHAFTACKSRELNGNTEALNVEWFAREIYQEIDSPWGAWDSIAEPEREHWREIASAALNRFPFLMNRIAGRCKVQAEAVKSLMQWEEKNAE